MELKEKERKPVKRILELSEAEKEEEELDFLNVVALFNPLQSEKRKKKANLSLDLYDDIYEDYYYEDVAIVTLGSFRT